MEAVIFDLGGVVLESPMPVIGRYEAAAGLSAGSINRVVAAAGPRGSWACLERGEIGRDAFFVDFSSELDGRLSPTDLTAMFEEIDATVTVRRAGLAAIRTIRSMGFLAAALTNTWESFPSGGLRSEFDVFCESVMEGTRKPEPEFYRRCVERLGVAPTSCVMLDDLGPNLKQARAMGMKTVKVESLDTALTDLERLLGCEGLLLKA